MYIYLANTARLTRLIRLHSLNKHSNTLITLTSTATLYNLNRHDNITES